MNDIARWLLFFLYLVIMPAVVLGTIRKTKARFQNRVGASVIQPLFDLFKFLKKTETISEITSWIFRSTAAVNFVVVLIIACLAPWTSLKPDVTNADIFLIVYLFGLMRFFTVLSALDAGSVFGGFGASREVTLALLVEPAIVLCLASLGVVARTSDLTRILSFPAEASMYILSHQPSLWLIAGCGLFLAALVELSRMPADDPTTHLELTMVHEAMILENSGKNLALIEYTHWLKMSILLGLCGQCFMHAIGYFWHCRNWARDVGSIVFLLLLALMIALIESACVRLRWTKVPEFIAYSVGMSLLCMLIAIGGTIR